MVIRDELRRIAKEIRAWAEDNLDDSVGDLSCKCAICSYELFIELKKNGFDSWFAQNDGHAFVICEGYIVDVTATQFGRKNKVSVLLLSSVSRKASFWWGMSKKDDFRKTRSLRIIKRWLKDWPVEQVSYVFERIRGQSRCLDRAYAG